MTMMTPGEYREALDAACQAAEDSGPEWNWRFVSALAKGGLKLVAPADDGGVPEPYRDGLRDLMAPQPFLEGWSYSYPAYVVPAE